MKFWKDKWCGDVALRTSYPALYAIVDYEDWVADVWHLIVEGGCWGPRFIRVVND